MKLNPEDAVSIEKIQKLSLKNQVDANFIFIHLTMYFYIPNTYLINSQNVLLEYSIYVIETVLFVYIIFDEENSSHLYKLLAVSSSTYNICYTYTKLII